jgi:glycosyltransferase involved in cell wall biosynthesis
MRIVVASVSSNRCMSGVSRHAANLVRCLLTRSEVSAVHVLVSPWEHQYVGEAIGRSDKRLRLHPVVVGQGALQRNLWYYRSLPAIAEQLQAEIVHIAYPSPIRLAAFPCPVITTLHDLYPYDIPENFGFPKVLFNRMILRQCLRHADAIACVSDGTKARLELTMPKVLKKAITIPNSVEGGPVPAMPAFVASWDHAPFLLCVAQHRRNKNVLLALRAFKRMMSAGQIPSATRLVIVGIPGPESGKIESFIRASGLVNSVVLVRGLSDAEMSWCYRNCELVVAPSIVEGFGLPVVEAQLAGSRIVCSDIPAFREVGSSACKFVKLTPDADQDFASAMLAALRERRPTPGYLPHLCSRVVAEQYIHLYGQVLAAKAATSGSRAAQQGMTGTTEAHVTKEVPNAAHL